VAGAFSAHPNFIYDFLARRRTAALVGLEALLGCKRIPVLDSVANESDKTESELLSIENLVIDKVNKSYCAAAPDASVTSSGET